MPSYERRLAKDIGLWVTEVFTVCVMIIGIILFICTYELFSNENYLMLPIVLILSYLEYYFIVGSYDGWQKQKIPV
jgi:hypothetical protein